MLISVRKSSHWNHRESAENVSADRGRIADEKFNPATYKLMANSPTTLMKPQQRWGPAHSCRAPRKQNGGEKRYLYKSAIIETYLSTCVPLRGQKVVR